MAEHDHVAVAPEAAGVDHPAGLGGVHGRSRACADVDALVHAAPAPAEARGQPALHGPREAQRAVLERIVLRDVTQLLGRDQRLRDRAALRPRDPELRAHRELSLVEDLVRLRDPLDGHAVVEPDAVEVLARLHHVVRARRSRRAGGEREEQAERGAEAEPLQPSHPWSPTRSTNLAAPSTSGAYSAPRASRRTRSRRCAPRGPNGPISRPPGASCASSGSGSSGPPAVTAMASYGASGGQPRVPSPRCTTTFEMPSRSSARRARLASAGTRSTEITRAARRESTAAWYAEPVPISSTRSVPVSASAALIAATVPGAEIVWPAPIGSGASS